MQELVLTTQQRLRMRRDREISGLYKKLRDENPDASDRRIVDTIAASWTKDRLTPSGIRACLVRSGAITPTPRAPKK